MAGGVARLGDPLSCGDVVSVGSSDVYANGMPVAIVDVSSPDPDTTGHGCWFPNKFIGPFTDTVFVNNKPVVIVQETRTARHWCIPGLWIPGSGDPKPDTKRQGPFPFVHDAVVVKGSDTVYAENEDA